MSTFDIFFDFLLCSLLFGLAKLPILFQKLSEIMQKKMPKKVKIYGIIVTVLCFFMAFCFCYMSYRNGTLDYLDLAATVVSGYFIAYVYFFKMTKNPIFAIAHLIIPVFLFLAVLFNSIGWAITAGIVFFVWFKIRRGLMSGLDKFVQVRKQIRQEVHKHAMDSLMNDIAEMQGRHSDPVKEAMILSMKREDIADFVAETIVKIAARSKIKNAEEINEQTSWQGDLGLNQDDLLLMRMVWETELIIDIDDCEIEVSQITTIKDVIDMLESKIC